MERRAIAIQGTVQGVGFRPFVFGLANEFRLSGFVKNNVSGVSIEIEGERDRVEQFLDALVRKLPPLAHIDEMTWANRPATGEGNFRIEPSDASPGGHVIITPDVATCDDCLRELFDPSDRRFEYPFLNCTNCGPRLTIVEGAPYDRARTTMSVFPMCPKCREEYEDPGNRRFHAQPTACADCGPNIFLMDTHGARVDCGKPLDVFAKAIQGGKIGAMKGLGGYHLVCDARDEKVIAELRRRKHRDEKPLAMMVLDLAEARKFCDVSEAEAELLCSPRRPIVLLRKRRDASLPRQIAPGNPHLGIMLPYTPLHHLLLRKLPGMPLVMTSGNRSDEPIACTESSAVEALGNICDLFLAHNRRIHVRCDDSVTRVIDGMESPIRRSRGYAPQPIALPFECSQPILAVGGQLKGTFALGIGRRAILSHHLGDLDHFSAFKAFENDVALYEKLFDVRPALIAHDLHPDYASTRYAIGRGVKLLPIQHHHAHMASCMAEHGLNEPVIGVSFDGTGSGLDGAVWGGEFLIGDYKQFKRAAHLRYVPMPGGEKVVHEPWRMAAAYLLDAIVICRNFQARISPSSWRIVQSLVERRINAPLTSSIGRLFDAVASLVGLRDQVSFEGQAAMQLECKAMECEAISADVGFYPFEIHTDASDRSMEIDLRPMILRIAENVDAGVEENAVARRFHNTLVEVISTICGKLRQTAGVAKVVLSGGAFMNSLLTLDTENRLSRDGFRVFRHCKVPPNDGGLCLGQLAIAAARSAELLS